MITVEKCINWTPISWSGKHCFNCAKRNGHPCRAQPSRACKNFMNASRWKHRLYNKLRELGYPASLANETASSFEIDFEEIPEDVAETECTYAMEDS